MESIVCNGIGKIYGKKQVLKNINLTLEKGKIYGLIGRNGAGKTTLLSIMSAQNPASEGTVTWNGENVWENRKALDHICFSRELSINLYGSGVSGMKVKDYLKTASYYYPDWDQALAEELIKKFELNTKQRINKMSKGMLSMVTIIVALASKADFTFMDEPVAGLDVVMRDYAENMEQISIYEADMTYAQLFEGQDIELWPIDEEIPNSKVAVIPVSDFNRALTMQGKEPITLNDDQYLLNCNYTGTYQYVSAALQNHSEITIGGTTLLRASDEVLQETYFMTSVGNNDRGTLIVPDHVVAVLEKDVNVLLVQYKPDVDSNEILQKMIPIGLDETHGYRYAEKNMMYEMFYGLNALVSFLCCYIGLIFLLICAALLALKQLTETTDNIYRYGLLQKLGAKRKQINRTLFTQTAVFFAIPLTVAGIYSAFLIGKAMTIVEEFMNIHISTNIGLTIILFLIVYGSYFLATYLSCKRIVTEQKRSEV